MITSKEYLTNTALNTLQAIENNESVKWIINGVSYAITYCAFFKFSVIESAMFYIFNLVSNPLVNQVIEALPYKSKNLTSNVGEGFSETGSPSEEGVIYKTREFIRTQSARLFNLVPVEAFPQKEEGETIKNSLLPSIKTFSLKIFKHLFFDVFGTEKPKLILEMSVRNMLARAISLTAMALLFGVAVAQIARILTIYLVFYAAALLFMYILNTKEISSYNPKEESLVKLLIDFIKFLKEPAKN